MAKLIAYLLESGAVLAFLYLLYTLALRRETFFGLNRFFLLGILVISLLFPLMSFDFSPAKTTVVERPIEEISKFRMSYYEAMALWEFDGRKVVGSPEKTNLDKSRNPAIGWAKLSVTTLLVLYAIGIVVFLSRIVWSFRWIWKMINTNPRDEIDGVTVIKIARPMAPFSFLNYVFVHDAMVSTPEFEQVLAHEKIHIRQWHSIDLIIVQLLAAFLWFNPVIWQLFKSLKTTHEYIADKKIISSGYSLVEYQTVLLKQLISNNSFGLVHNFNLSFIKKRIAMMKNRKSGWTGKAKAAIAIICTVAFSAIIVQCNSRLEEQVSGEAVTMSVNDFSGGVNLPVLPERGYIFNGDLTDAANITIAGNNLSINGDHYGVDEIIPVIENAGLTENGIIVLRIDRDQSMSLIAEVFQELRKAERRKILFLGQTDAGKKVDVTLLLPPTPENAAKHGIPMQTDIDELVAAGKMEILEIDLGSNAGYANQQKVYDFVTNHVLKQSSGYVVSAKFNDDDTYNEYLVNLVYTMEGFNQIYQERSREMFGKDFYETDKEEYNAVRKGVPMAISIADKPE